MELLLVLLAIATGFISVTYSIVRLERELRSTRNEIMSQIDALVAAVTAEEQVIDSAIKLIDGIVDELKQLRADERANWATDTQAVNDLVARINAKREALAAAVATGTVADAPPEPAPAPVEPPAPAEPPEPPAA